MEGGSRGLGGGVRRAKLANLVHKPSCVVGALPLSKKLAIEFLSAMHECDPFLETAEKFELEILLTHY